MPSAYIARLNRELVEAATEPVLSIPDLRQRFLDWLDSVPEVSRYRPYSMMELEKALGTQGRYLSPILLSLGWCRKRKWSSRGQYHRYWVPREAGNCIAV
jgi:hypothetical protein